MIDRERNRAGAWYYPMPSGAAALIKGDVAFSRGVKVKRVERA